MIQHPKVPLLTAISYHENYHLDNQVQGEVRAVGAKSTVTLPRAMAINNLAALLPMASNELLARLLEELNDEAGQRSDWDHYMGLYNFRVVRE